MGYPLTSERLGITDALSTKELAMMSLRTPTAAAGRKCLRLAAGLAAGALLLAACGGSSKSSATTTMTTSTTPTTTKAPQPAVATAVGNAHEVSASSGGVTASLRAGTHKPRVQAPWPIHFTVTQSGQPAAASVSYEYMFGGQVVAHRSHYTFKGHFSDVFRFPSAAVGYPLTFRAVITSGATTIDLDYPVQVST
jgi:hypothetical protein